MDLDKRYDIWGGTTIEKKLSEDGRWGEFHLANNWGANRVPGRDGVPELKKDCSPMF